MRLRSSGFVALWMAGLVRANAAHADAPDAVDTVLDARCVREPRLDGVARLALARAESLDGASLRDRAERDGVLAPSVRAWAGRGRDAAAVSALAGAWIARQAPVAWSRCGAAHTADAWAVVMVPRLAEVDGPHGEMPRTAQADVTATLPSGARDASLVLLRPDGTAGPVAAVGAGRWTVALDQPGTYALQVIAQTAQGPLPFATWHARIDGAVIPLRTVQAPAPEDPAGVLVWINRQRAAVGASPLRADPLLGALARQRAVDLGARASVVHALREGDGPVARLADAHLGADRLAENVARARSVAEACARLDASPSHRANRVDPTLDAVGIGVAEAGPDSYYVVELFATHPRIADE